MMFLGLNQCLLLMIDLQIYKHYNWIKTKLNCKLFTKVFRDQAKESWVWIDRAS